jgi:hypothetical protein
MEALFRFLAGYEILIYFFLGIGFILALRWLWRAFRETQDAIYGLEKQIAFRHLSTAIASIALIIFLLLGELYITSFLVPDLPATTFLPTPTVNILSTQQSNPPSDLNAPISATDVGTGSVTQSIAGCTSDAIMITNPLPGQELNGVVELFGIVDVKDLGFYKIEYSSAGFENWATFFAGREISPDQPIGVWDTSQLPSGDYQVRLVVTDNQGQDYPPCVITFRVTGGQ